jgi:hypothetical protein
MGDFISVLKWGSPFSDALSMVVVRRTMKKRLLYRIKPLQFRNGL